MRQRRSQGLTLLECMLLVMLLGIISLGFGIALQSIAHIPDGVEQRMAIHTLLVDKMEDIMSQDFAIIAANSGLSDTVTVQGQSVARSVTVAAVDADGTGSVDADFVEVTVSIADQSLKTRVTQP
jgi:hypothetical protein